MCARREGELYFDRIAGPLVASQKSSCLRARNHRRPMFHRPRPVGAAVDVQRLPHPRRRVTLAAGSVTLGGCAPGVRYPRYLISWLRNPAGDRRSAFSPRSTSATSPPSRHWGALTATGSRATSAPSYKKPVGLIRHS